jgi:hypothetical protein
MAADSHRMSGAACAARSATVARLTGRDLDIQVFGNGQALQAQRIKGTNTTTASMFIPDLIKKSAGEG